jgi:hypothetical protein
LFQCDDDADDVDDDNDDDVDDDHRLQCDFNDDGSGAVRGI